MKLSSITTTDLKKSEQRFDAAFHLSTAVSIRRMIQKQEKYPIVTVSDIASRIFYGTRASRTYVTKKENAIPFLTGASILLNNFENTKLISKKYTPAIDEMTLHEGWVLITRSGTVGQVAWANKLFEGKYGSEDIIRVVPNGRMKGGILYAFLASKYGNSLLTQGAFGAVVQHIEPDFIGNICIPEFSKSIQDEVDLLIRQSATLREDADKLLKKAHSIIELSTPLPTIALTSSESSKRIFHSHSTRLEGHYYASKNRALYDYLMTLEGTTILKDAVSKIFRPGIFKREYVDNGVTFLGGADIMLATPKSSKKLSFRQVSKMPELNVKKGWILVTCGGTIGNSVYVDNQISQCTVSQHVMRIVPNDNTNSGFLYAYLSSEIGYNLITLFTYGSVIPSLEPHHLELVPIPHYNTSVIEETGNLVSEYAKKLELAKQKELEAIFLVEREIESWKK